MFGEFGKVCFRRMQKGDYQCLVSLTVERETFLYVCLFVTSRRGFESRARHQFLNNFSIIFKSPAKPLFIHFFQLQADQVVDLQFLRIYHRTCVIITNRYKNLKMVSCQQHKTRRILRLAVHVYNLKRN